MRKKEPLMKVLNLYFSATGNTAKVAETISATVQQEGHQVDTVKITKDAEIDVLPYDLVFVGSGVYEWLPGLAMQKLFAKLRRQYVAAGQIKSAAPRRPGKNAAVYCTYGGAHTGINEAIPAVKYMGQLFDHLGFEIVGEWYLVGEYHGKYKDFSVGGRLGNIQGRPNEADLQDLAEKVKGVLNI
jgi:flavodoxin